MSSPVSAPPAAGRSIGRRVAEESLGLTPAGYAATAATLLAVLLAELSANLLLLSLATAGFALVATDVIVFLARSRGVELSRFSLEPTDDRFVVPPGGTLRVSLGIRYDGARPIQARVEDSVHLGLNVRSGARSAEGWWTPGTQRRLDFVLRTGLRGSFQLGPVRVVVLSPARFAWRRRALVRSERTLWVVPTVAVGRYGRLGPGLFTRIQGRLALRKRGFGTEFRGLRPYQPSDDPRHIAWRRSRPGEWYVREFEQESRQDFLVLLDVSSSMTAGIRPATALDHAAEAGIALVEVVARSGEDRIGLATFAGGIRQFIRPRRGRGHFASLIQNLAFVAPQAGEFSLGRALSNIEMRIPRGTHVLLFTALEPAPARLREAHARMLSRGHHLCMVVPNRGAYYPNLPSTGGRTAMAWSQSGETQRLGSSIAAARADGIPVITYDRRGAVSGVIGAYSRIRGWGALG